VRQNYCCAQRCEVASGALSETAACPRDDYDFAFNVVAHFLSLLWRGLMPRGVRSTFVQKALLNALKGPWKKNCRTDLGEQFHQIRNWLRIKLLHSVDDLVPQTFTRKRFRQPLELLDSPLPRQRMVRPPS